jgi:ureidoglycolate dehydrogenase (NAD+)
VFLQVVDPASFGDPARYVDLVDQALDAAKRQPPADGVAEVLVPGEPEERARAKRSREGIPLPAATWSELQAVGTRFEVPLPPSPPGA